jgi:hypothetical protein
MSKKPLTTKALADAAEVSAQTVRRFERRGLIHAVRDVNGWRKFAPSEVERLRELLGWKILEREDQGRPDGARNVRESARAALAKTDPRAGDGRPTPPQGSQPTSRSGNAIGSRNC